MSSAQLLALETTDPLNEVFHQCLDDADFGEGFGERIRLPLGVGHQDRHGCSSPIPPMAWYTDAFGRVCQVNAGAALFFGCSSHQSGDVAGLANRWEDLIHPDDRERVIRLWLDAIETKQSFLVRYRISHGDAGYRWVEGVAEPLQGVDSFAVAWVVVTRDIDSRIRAAEHLRTVEQALERERSDNALYRFAAAMAHEINQPLTALLNQAAAARSWLLGQTPNIPRAVQAVERIIRDGHATGAAVKGIRALFSSERAALQSLEMTDLVRSVHDRLADRLNRSGIRFETEIPGNPHVRGDREQIEIVLINLITNSIEALEHANGAGDIVISAHEDTEGWVLVEVLDNGPGIDPNEAVFDAFYTTKTSGMGMGLAVSKAIIEAHGGTISAATPPQGGGRVRISLPAGAV